MTQAEIEADPARWLDERLRDPQTGQWRIGASEMAAVMGFAPPEQGSPFSLYHAKAAGVVTFRGSDRTDVGSALEDLTAAKFADANPHLTVGPGGLYASRDYPWACASFDRLAWRKTAAACGCPDALAHEAGCTARDRYDLAGPVQCKTWAKRDDFGEAGGSAIPVHLRIQGLMELLVSGADDWWEPVMWLPSGQVTTFRLHRDAGVERDLCALVAGGEEFVSWLDEELPPEPDWTPATTKTLRALYPQITEGSRVRVPVRLARRYRAARLASDRAGRRLAAAQNELRHLMQDAAEAVIVDPATGEYATVARRTGGPVAGYSVAPKEWREALNPGPWAKQG